MSEDVKLEPCPHCGGEAEVTVVFSWFPRCMTPNCINELGSGRPYGSKEDAIAAWNTRPTEQAAHERGKAAERARIVEAIEKYKHILVIASDNKKNSSREDSEYRGAVNNCARIINIVNQAE